VVPRHLGRLEVYKYDGLYRLTSLKYRDGTTDSYSYDAVGNRLSKNSTSYAYDDADQLTSVGGVSYSYDGNGNLTTRGSDSFSWDHDNRLTSATVSSVTTTFAYNGNGLRHSLTTGGNTKVFTWDVVAGVPQVLDDQNFKYAYGLRRISQSSSGSQFYSYDGLGSASVLTDAGASVTNSYEYDVFGAIRANTGSQANAAGFTGELADPSTGLYFLRSRYYDPGIGRFLGKDGFPGFKTAPSSLNGYAYVENNPVVFVDPYGLFKIKIKGTTLFDSKKVGRAVSDAADRLADAAVPALTQCLIWGAQGAVVGGVSGAAAGCMTGGGIVLVEALIGDSPITDCLGWGANNLVGALTKTATTRAAAALVGCGTGLLGDLLPDDPLLQCLNWGAGSFVSAKVVGARAVKATVSGCIAGGTASTSAGRAEAPAK
jgi:RHS repeat-associated protein